MENVGNRHAIRRDSEVCNKYQKLKDEQQRIQVKTFTNWINAILSQNGDSSRRVIDLIPDIKDGVVLLQVLETLTNSKLGKTRPDSTRRPLQISNVSTALDYLRKKGIRLVNVNCTDIVDGKPSIVLGLVWKIILYVQIQDNLGYDIKRNNGYNIGNLLKNGLFGTPTLEAKDFGPCWRDGQLFNKLINTIKPGAVDTSQIKPENARENLQTAFRIAETQLDIPQLLDPEDVDVDKPDEMSIITYVGQFVAKYPNDVDVQLKTKLLNRAQRLNGSPMKSRTNSTNSLYNSNTQLSTPQHQHRTIPYIFIFILVLLYRCIWFIICIFIIYDTLFSSRKPMTSRYHSESTAG